MLSEQAEVLEQENEQLSRLVNSMGENLEKLNYLIDLVESDILWKEERLHLMSGMEREKMQAIVAAYRAVRPKEGADNN